MGRHPLCKIGQNLVQQSERHSRLVPGNEEMNQFAKELCPLLISHAYANQIVVSDIAVHKVLALLDAASAGRCRPFCDQFSRELHEFL